GLPAPETRRGRDGAPLPAGGPRSRPEGPPGAAPARSSTRASRVSGRERIPSGRQREPRALPRTPPGAGRRRVSLGERQSADDGPAGRIRRREQASSDGHVPEGVTEPDRAEEGRED